MHACDWEGIDICDHTIFAEDNSWRFDLLSWNVCAHNVNKAK